DSAPPVRGQPALERWDTRDMRPAAPAVGSVGEDDPSPLSKSAPLRLSPAQLSRSHQQMRYVLPAMKMPRIRRAKLLICLAILSFQCVRSSQPLDSLRDAATAAKSGDAGSRQLALAGFHALLVQADFAKAQSLFETAVKRTPPDPYALMGEIIIQQRLAHPERALLAALELCERSPAHPLASAAARYVFDVAGNSTALDEVIVGRAQKVLLGGVPGEPA